ncbi:hypothetical protein GC174_03070 [bacterium]|nr:hypothetical protein [bacterium]
MNVERWLKVRKKAWDELDKLLSLTDKDGVGALDRKQLQELGRLYRSTSADLSRARALKLSGDIQVYLNNLVVRAHNQVYQTDKNRWKDLFAFLWIGFPRLVRENILYIITSFLLFACPAWVGYSLVQKNLNFAQYEIARGQPLVPEDMFNSIEKKQMWTDAVEGKNALAFSMISTNNIGVSIKAFVFGISFGIGTIFVLLLNGLHIGTALGVCKIYGMAPKLLTFVAAHGVIELNCIFISGGAGLMMGAALLFPGQYKRVDMFKIAAKKAAGLFAGTVPLLLIAGCIEGFISPRTDIDPWVKYAVSLSTLILLALYIFAPRKFSGNTDGGVTEVK